MSAVTPPVPPGPPVAPRRPLERQHHGQLFTDDWEWLRDTEDPEVVAHLQAENAWTDAQLAPQDALRERIFGEIKARTQQTDVSVPSRHGQWWYYTRTVEGQQYPLHARVAATGEYATDRPRLDAGNVPAGEQVLLDGNAEAGDSTFFSLGGFTVSRDDARLAFAVDTAGDERFAVTVVDLATGERIDESITGVGYGLCFSHDATQLYYVRVDESWRPHEVWRHTIGADPATDELLHTESDEAWWMGLDSSGDERWVLIGKASSDSSEWWLVDATDPASQPQVVQPRQDRLEYDVDVAGRDLLLVHTLNTREGELATATVDAPGLEHWQQVSPPAEGERLLGCELFEHFALVSMRRDGLTGLRLLPRGGQGEPATSDDGLALGAPVDVVPDEALYTLGAGTNPEFTATTLQVVTESLVTPPTTSEYDLAPLLAGDPLPAPTVLRQQPVLGGYDPAAYTQERLWATAQDGTRIPISLVRRNDVEPDGTAPGLLTGYGAYEVSNDPDFRISRLSLLDRGVVFAIAHVRGGGEMGRAWYEAGRMEHKANSFTDLNACAHALVDAGWVDAGRLAVEGGSAGGLLLGAAINLEPDLYRAAHLAVPFVDALTTILNPELPLTVGEWTEWGNPLADSAVYDRMASYTPYENVRQAQYPAMLATTSLNDTRVGCGEPTKWVQAVRSQVTNDPIERPVLLRTEMVAGHGGRSGRYDAWRDRALELAFLLTHIGVES
ncbi:oligopeptidase B [Kytococcus aerolatus]|uniref:Oligopeptidase B n=1 Tax=Kytococcus aerolatus TaxID=592308 RepID=A0A212T4V2_9MICO|nr:S9 family peptidase [Kytococcus aerolatus]SNC60851.1 oligopeptidase B [Kytococcus aerolatus]